MNDQTPISGDADARPFDRKVLPDGIYFDLDEGLYHSDPALGSTDMKGLARNPVAWWYGSVWNPRRPDEKDTKALTFGKAVHAMVLEGREHLDRRFGPTFASGSTKEGKAERAALHDAGRQAIPFDDYERALVAGTYVRADPELQVAFLGGRSEVSVFWTRDGIRRKARFDYLKTRSIVDLKSTREQEEMDFDAWCKREIGKRRYYVQAAHYLEARSVMKGLPVFGDCDLAWLAKVVLQEEPFFTWVFYQSTGAPETFGTYTTSNSRLVDMGKSLIQLAEHNYRTYSENFGLDAPWVNARKLEAYDENEQPEWVWR